MFDMEGFEKSKNRFRALWEKEVIDRCCISVTAPKDSTLSIKHKDEFLPSEEEINDPEKLERYYTDPELILERHLKKFDQTFFGGDAFPCIMPFMGCGGHAGYFKNSKIRYAKDTIWFDELIDDWDCDILEFDKDSDILKKQMNCMKYLSEKGKGKFFVSVPDNCGSMDALAQLRSNGKLLMDLYENPEKVRKGLNKLIKALKITGDEMFDMLKENNHGGSVQQWMQTWCPSRHMQLQCDLSVMISPQLFEEFVLPELEETSQWLDRAIYHFDGQEQIRHLDMILSVKKIDMIQWTPVAGQPLTSDFIPVLQKIQKAGKGLVLLPQANEVGKLLENLSPKGLHMVVYNLESEEDAKQILKMVSI